MKIPGFTLIELAIGLFLSTIIGLALYTSFFVTSRVVGTADNLVSFDTHSVLIQNQLDKDLAGIFVPETIVSTQTTQKKAEAVTKSTESKNTSTGKETAPAETNAVEKIFYSSNQGAGLLDVLTFVTNNPMKVYENAKNARVKPRIARVVYRLIAQKDEPIVFTLLRQEAPTLDLKAFDLSSAQHVRAYELATNIKSLTVEYSYPEDQQEAQSSTPGKEEEKKSVYKTSAVWDVEKEEKMPKVPQFITVVCQLWDGKRERIEEFTFHYENPTFNSTRMQQLQEKKTTGKKPAEKPLPQTTTTKTDEKKPVLQQPATTQVAQKTSPIQGK